MNKYIALHPNYYGSEGFGTLMSHYTVLYSIYKDTGLKPVIYYLKSNNDALTAMQAFNQNNGSIIYHEHAFPNFNKHFEILDQKEIINIDWRLVDLRTINNYNRLIQIIKLYQNNNIIFLWTLNSNLVYNTYINEIKNYLYQFNDDILNQCKNLLPKTNKKNVAVCFRTEYEKIGSGHTKLSLNFYKQAMKYFNTTNTKFLFFSDDLNLTRQRCAELETEFDIEYTEPMQSAIGMCLMSLCDHIICANSSFSYWASILNRNSNCTIICPTQFVEPGADIYLGLNYKWYPKNWVALDLV